MAVRQRYDNIQILRGIAALGVVFDHAAIPFFEANDTLLYRAFMFSGYIGVWIFFVISGFIMGVTSFDEFGAVNAPKKFIVRRFIRVAPLYYLVTFFKFIVSFNKTTVDALILSLLFIPYINEQGAVRPLQGQGWTLNYEMFFYVIFAVAMMLALKKGLPFLFSVMIGLVCLGYVIPQQSGWLGALLSVYTDPLLLLFVSGVAVALAAMRTKFMSSQKLGYLIGPFYGLLFVEFLIGRMSPAFEQNIMPSLLGLTCILLVAVSATPSKLDELVKSGPAYGMLMKLGDASYAIYLTHTFVVSFFMKADQYLHFGPLFVISGCVVFSVLLGLCVFRFIERPLAIYFSRRIVRRPPSGGQAVEA